MPSRTPVRGAKIAKNARATLCATRLRPTFLEAGYGIRTIQELGELTLYCSSEKRLASVL